MVLQISGISKMKRPQVCYGFGISLPRYIVDKIDAQRGYIPRSKWILMALETLADATNVNKSLYSGQAKVSSPAVNQNTESVSTVGEYNVS